MALESVHTMKNEFSYNQRENAIQGHEKKFGIETRYTGTKKQNEELLSQLKSHPELLKKFESERKSITHDAKKELASLKKEYEPGNANTYVSDMSVYNEKEAGGSETASGKTVHYSSNPEIPTTCAANWGKFPPGTILRLNGKKYIVEDYGSYVNKYPDRIDRYLPHRIYKDSLVKNPRVEVLQWGDFAKAESILRKSKPQRYPHVAMMLKQVRMREKIIAA